MYSVAIRNSNIAFDIDENLRIRLREIGRISFNTNREDVESYEFPVEDSEGLPRTREVSELIKKILNRLINNRIVTSPLTLDIYNGFIDAYETDPDFKPQGEILEMLALTYDCYIQAYLTDLSSKPNFWAETSKLSQQKHLENFHALLEWRLENSLKIGFLGRISLFMNLTNLSYGINFENLIHDYMSNIDLYIRNVSNILIENAMSVSNTLHSAEKDIANNANLSKSNESSDSLLAYSPIERTPEETAEGLRKITELFKRQQDLWNSLTEDERETSNSEFLIRHEELMRLRSE